MTRRAVVGGLGAVGFGLGLTGLADGRRRENPVDPEGSWPSYAGDVANTGWVAGPDGVATAVEERWAVESEPRPNELSVHGGRVYVGRIDGGVVALSREGGLRAVADDDGTERWTFDVDDHGGTPTVHDGTVYLAGPTTLYALDAADGAVRARLRDEDGRST